jgi:hypothetical protein
MKGAEDAETSRLLSSVSFVSAFDELSVQTIIETCREEIGELYRDPDW